MKLLPPALVALALTGVAFAQTSTPPPTPPPADVATPPPAPEPPPPPPAPRASRLIYGGGVGLSFGDVDYIEIAPMIGFKVTPKTHLGVSLLYRYRDDNNYDVTTSDYGGSVFARYFPFGGFFVQGEYEWVNYEYAYLGGSSDRQVDSNALAGGGFSQAMGAHASFYVSGMYNFSYDGNDPYEPYDSPWVFRVGVGFGF
jgi:hypothetical protein